MDNTVDPLIEAASVAAHLAVENILRDRLGREPTLDDIAPALAISLGDCMGLIAADLVAMSDEERLLQLVKSARNKTLLFASKETSVGSA